MCVCVSQVFIFQVNLISYFDQLCLAHRHLYISAHPIFYIYIFFMHLIQTTRISGSTTAGKIERFVCFYLPLWVAFFLNFVLYYKASSTLKRFALLSDLGASSKSSSSSRANSSASFSSNNGNIEQGRRLSTNDMEITETRDEERSGGLSPESERLFKMANHLRWYPLIFVISWLVNTVVRVIQAIHPAYDDMYLFSLIQVLGNG
jgi:hypothetical protein